MRILMMIAAFIAAIGCTVVAGMSPATTVTVIKVVPTAKLALVGATLDESYLASFPEVADEPSSVSDFRTAITAPPGKIPAQFTFTQ